MRRRSATASAGCSPRCSGSRPKGDYAAAKTLFETYGIHFDPKLRDEVVARVERLNLPSYTGFVHADGSRPVTGADGDDHRREDLVSAGPDGADARNILVAVICNDRRPFEARS